MMSSNTSLGGFHGENTRTINQEGTLHQTCCCPASDPPGAPTRVTPSDIAKDAVTLNWFEPDEDGGSPITGYWIEKFDPDSDKWIRCNKLPIRDTTFR